MHLTFQIIESACERRGEQAESKKQTRIWKVEGFIEDGKIKKILSTSHQTLLNGSNSESVRVALQNDKNSYFSNMKCTLMRYSQFSGLSESFGMIIVFVV